MNNRIREIRKKLKLTLEQVAEAAGTTNQHLGMLERGKRGLTLEWMERIAPALGVEVAELLDTADARKIPVVGYVGAGFQIYPVDDHMKGAGLDEVDAPPGIVARSAVAVICRGDSMIPVLDDGDVIYYDQQIEGDMDSLIGRLCVVQCTDGATYVKQMKKADGRYWLHSHNADPIFPAGIAWAARVLWIKKQ
jgi:phage repressor protein C with HTH and peptisase S24 domain